jgi:hypothetical protein
MEPSGLDSLYVYDTSCSVYERESFNIDSEITLEQLNEIDRIIDSLPADVGR